MSYEIKKKIGVASLLLSIVFMTACGDLENTQSADDAIENGGAYKVSEASEVSKESLKKNDALLHDKADDKDDKVSEVHEVDKASPIVLSVNKTDAVTDSFDESLNKLDKVIHSNDGYIVSHEMTSQEGNRDRKNRRISMAIRVPKENLESTLDFISKEFYIKSESSNTIDISKDYYDIHSRFESLEKQEDRLNDLIESADNLNEIIRIGDELTNISNEKKILEASKSEIEYRANYSRININLEEVDKMPNKEKLSSIDEISETLSKTTGVINDTLVKIAMLLITFSPMIVIGVVAHLLFKKYGWIIKSKIESEDDKINEDE